MLSSVIPSPSTRSFSRNSERGVALVITLSFLLIVTAIIIAFLTRSRFDVQASASYSAAIQSDLLAAGALDKVIAETIEEITSPDSSDFHGDASGGFRWFEPKAEGNTFPSMVPHIAARVESSAPARNNLIKQSIAEPYYPGGPTRLASGVNSSSTEGGARSRYVSPQRWDLPQLLLNSSGDALGEFTEGETPDWIYLKENGEPTASSQDAKQIIGRYSYNVYDVGGLLNANVAGFVSPGISPENAGTKGSTVLADLTAIPGLSNQGSVNEVVEWRTSPFVSWGGTWNDAANPIPTGNLSPLDYIRLGSATGWRWNPSVEGRQGNQFLSRRDLQKYLADRGLEEALPFLTHFSVDADAPTYSPPSPNLLSLRGIYELKESDSAGNTISNGDLPRMNPERFAADTISQSLPLPNGDTEAVPVLSSRFPLSRLALVQTDPSARATAGSTPALVREYFGLQAVDDFTWKYIDPTIKTLNQVAAENRRPNFFEILKSVVSVGSLGQSKQRIHSSIQQTQEPRANIIDEHIIRIGAAIIDQADPDSYPTRIQFNYNSANEFGELYGVEDIPYIQAIRFVAYSKEGGDNYNSQSGRVPKLVLAQPALWNPHDPFRTSRNPGSTPTDFQIVARNVIGGQVIVTGNGFENIEQYGIFEGQSLSFTWTPDGEVFRQPQGLLSPLYPNGISLTGPTYFKVNAAIENAPFVGIVPQPFTQSSAIGFRIAEDPDAPPLPASRVNSPMRFDGGGVQFLLQYDAPGGPYTYDRFWWSPLAFKIDERTGGDAAKYNSNTFSSGLAGRNNPNAGTNNIVRYDSLAVKSDPRSQRFIFPCDMANFRAMTPGAYPRLEHLENTGLGWFAGTTTLIPYHLCRDVITSGANDPGWTVVGNTPGPFISGTRIRNDYGLISVNRRDLPGSNNVYYTDPDGVTRRAMGAAANLSSVATETKARTGISGSNNPVQLGLPLQASFPQSANRAYYPSRPIVLNRPFRSVGELAHAFRDVPWKNIDFSFPESADTGLLDVFTVYENEQPDTATPLVAGKVNVNVAPLPVLEALLRGTSRKLATDADAETLAIDAGLATTIADRIQEYRGEGTPSESENGVNGPLRSRAELVGRVYSTTGGRYSSSASFVGLNSNELLDEVLQERFTALSRSLADTTTTRTWNLMIDLVAQSGTLAQGAALQDFNTSSESRWWMFVSIDRFTGKILARSVERVVE